MSKDWPEQAHNVQTGRLSNNISTSGETKMCQIDRKKKKGLISEKFHKEKQLCNVKQPAATQKHK